MFSLNNEECKIWLNMIIKLDKYFLLFENIEEIKRNIVDILKSSDNYEIKI